MRCVFFAAIVLAAGCSYSPTGPTQMTLGISRASLPVGGSAIVTATLLGTNRALVTFNSSLGTFAPPETYAVNGVATSTFTATQSGVGAIGALSGSVAAETLQVSIGDVPTLPAIVVVTPPPVASVSCDGGVVGVPLICSVSLLHASNAVMQWGDGAAEQPISPSAASVAHVFGRADRFIVSVRVSNGSGAVATASTTATVVAPPSSPPPPAIPLPIVTTSVLMSQEANVGVSGCAAFNVGATPATGATISTIVVTGAALATPVTFAASSGRLATCGLTANVSILTATATDSNGGTATYPLIVR